MDAAGGDAVGVAVGLGEVVGLGDAVAEEVGFGVGETVGVVTTGTEPKNVKFSKMPVGVFSNDARTTVAGAVPRTGILPAK